MYLAVLHVQTTLSVRAKDGKLQFTGRLVSSGCILIFVSRLVSLLRNIFRNVHYPVVLFALVREGELRTVAKWE